MLPRIADVEEDAMGFANATQARLGATLLACASYGAACGAGSELDEYDDGVVPDIIPKPEAGGSNGGGSGSGANGVGSACKEDKNCSDSNAKCSAQASLFSVVNITFTGGYCTTACASSADCPADSACVTGSNVCLKTCTTNDACRTAESYTCQSVPLVGGGKKYCLPPMSGGGGLLGGLGGLFGSAVPTSQSE